MTAQYTAFRFQIPSDSFDNVPGALLNFYEAGTLNRVTVYADADLDNELSNPVEADGFGLFPTIFLVPDDYDIVATDEDGVPLWTNEDYTVQDIPVLDSDYFSLIDGEYVPGIAVNAQTGTGYTVLDSDRAKLITFNNSSGGTITLPAPTGSDFPNKWFSYISNIGTGSFTISSAANINGSGTFILPSNSFTLVVSNGSTYSAGATTNYNQIFTKPGGTLSVSSNTITIGAFSEYLVNTSSAPQTLTTINGGSSGAELVLKISSASNALTITSAGNITLPAGESIVLSALKDNVLLRYDAVNSKWDVQSYQNAHTTLVVPNSVAKAWVNFNGTGVVAIRSSYNVTSITDVNTGKWTVNFTTAMPDANYCVVVTGSWDYAGSAYMVGVDNLTPQTVNGFTIITKTDDGAPADMTYVNAIVFGN